MQNYGLLKIACASPHTKVGDPNFNSKHIIEMINEAALSQIKVICFPELSITGYTCGDLFFQNKLLNATLVSLNEIAQKTKHLEILSVVGLPLVYLNKLYNVAAVFTKGKILGFVPKANLPNYSEFGECRYFSKAPNYNSFVNFNNKAIPFGKYLIFECQSQKEIKISIEICEDFWTSIPESSFHSMAGSTLILNLSASDEIAAKADYRRQLVSSQSAKSITIYAYSSCAYQESTTDLVFSGHRMICENGTILSETRNFKPGLTQADVDFQIILHDRLLKNTFKVDFFDEFDIKSKYKTIEFDINLKGSNLKRQINPHPFLPTDEQDKKNRCEEILSIQSFGLIKRLEHTQSKNVVIGVSGGSDSCLALLAARRALFEMNRPMSNIMAVTMPCFGTTSTTLKSAKTLSGLVGARRMKIDITKNALSMLEALSHNESDKSVVYENLQARIRISILMNLANKHQGIVIGTGDMSEAALGWSTYNGDHMSMYNVNSGIPKTLVRYLINYLAETNPELSEVLFGILETPISPELLPSSKEIPNQQTEEIVGPFELHDFFLYHTLRYGFSPKKVFYLASYAFKEMCEYDEILKWLGVFYERFFAGQFKRNCCPDGPKIGSVCLSPRGDFKMPSDAVANLWLLEIEELQNKHN